MREAGVSKAFPRRIAVLQTVFLPAGTLLYFFAARMGMTNLSPYLDNIALLWLPAGIGLVMALVGGRSALPLIFLASLLANMPGMQRGAINVPLLPIAISAAANVLEAWLAVLLIKRYLPEGIRRLPDLLTFIIRVCLVVTAVNAVIMAGNLSFAGYIELDAISYFVGMLIFSNTLGMLLVYSLYNDWQRYMPSDLKQWVKWLALTMLLMLMIWLAFTRVYALIFLVPPTLLFFLYYSQDRGVSLVLLLSMGFVVWMATKHAGAFSVDSLQQARFMLFTYLFSTTVGVLAMALQRRSLLTETQQRRNWQFRANHDPLTGLRNRLSFVDQLDTEILRAQRTGRDFTVGMVDIDHFKQINDTWGHQTGDRVLKVFAERLKLLLREVDIVARYGGEEFIILFPEAALQEAWQALERVRENFASAPLEVEGQQISLTISGGLAPWHHGQPVALDEVLNQADRYLYQAKGEGRNQILYG